jgi:hypothetical protein
MMQLSALGHFLELLEALPVIVNELLELREQCLVAQGEEMLEAALWLARFSLVCFHHPFDLNKVS